MGVASPHSQPSGKVDMKDYVLKEKPGPASNEMVWAFDLGKGSIGDSPSPRWGATVFNFGVQSWDF